MKLNRTDALKLLKVGTVVRHKSGQLCMVEDFDVTRRPDDMPIKLKGLYTHELIEAVLADVTAVLTEVGEEPTGEAAAKL